MCTTQARATRLNRHRREYSTGAFDGHLVVGDPIALVVQLSVGDRTWAAAIVVDEARAKTERRHTHGSYDLKQARTKGDKVSMSEPGRQSDEQC